MKRPSGDTVGAVALILMVLTVAVVVIGGSISAFREHSRQIEFKGACTQAGGHALGLDARSPSDEQVCVDGDRILFTRKDYEASESGE
jgi:hypothetical protein